MLETIAARIGLVAVATVVAFGIGWKVRGDHEQARQLDQALAYAEAIKSEQAMGEQIAADYAAVVTWQQGRVRTRTEEVIRETTRTEYQCPVLATGRLLINGAVREANSAAALRLDPDLRAAP